MKSYTAEAAKQMLIEGNQRYTATRTATIAYSGEAQKGGVPEQNPYAVIITCADSRVIPEMIFSAGVAELFIVRVAGNVVDAHCLGSIEYALEHLGAKLVVVLGHDHCGAVRSALHHHNEGYVKCVTDEILNAVGDEKDEEKACLLNVRHSCRVIEEKLQVSDFTVIGAVYHLESGKVEFI